MLTDTLYCKTLSPMKNELGRPPKPAAERRSVILNLRITRAQQRELAAAAKRKGLSASDYIRLKLFGGKNDTGTTRSKA